MDDASDSKKVWAVLITPAAEEVRTKTGRCLGEEGCGR